MAEKTKAKDKMNLTALEYIDLFKKFSKAERRKILKEINLLSFDQEWRGISAQMPDAKISEEEIMEEVKAVRYGKNRGN